MYKWLKILLMALLTALPSFCNSLRSASMEKENIWLFVEKREYPQLHCVANSAGALIWNKNIEEGYYITSSKYLPTPANNSFDCNNPVSPSCDKDWRSAWSREPSSIASNDFKDFVLDKRWEGFYMLDNKSKKPFSEYLPEKFTIPLSVRANCLAVFKIIFQLIELSYEFFLDACNSTNSMVIGSNKNHPTKVKLDDYLKKNMVPHFDEFTYTHLKFTRSSSYITLRTESGEPFFEHWPNALSNNHDMTILIETGTNANNIWKIHNYSYLKTTLSKKFKIGPRITPTDEGYICISIFLAACEGCSFKVNVLPSNQSKNEKTRESKPYFPKNNIEWEEVKFEFDNLESREYTLAVETVKNKYGHVNGAFWAIGGARICQKIEFQAINYLTIDPKINIECEQLKLKDSSLKIDRKSGCTSESVEDEFNGIDCTWFTQNKKCYNLTIHQTKGSCVPVAAPSHTTTSTTSSQFTTTSKENFSTSKPPIKTEEEVDTTVTIATSIGIVFGLIGIIVIIALAIYIVRRRNSDVTFMNSFDSHCDSMTFMGLSKNNSLSSLTATTEIVSVEEFDVYLKNALLEGTLDKQFFHTKVESTVGLNDSSMDLDPICINDSTGHRRFCIFSKIDNFIATSFWETVWNENFQFVIWLITNKLEEISWSKNRSFEYNNLAIRMTSIDKLGKNGNRILYEINKGIEVKRLTFLCYNLSTSEELSIDTLRTISEGLLFLPKKLTAINLWKSRRFDLVGTLLFVNFCLKDSARNGTLDSHQILLLIQKQCPELIPTIDTYKTCLSLISRCLESIANSTISYADLIQFTDSNDFVNLQIKLCSSGSARACEIENELYMPEDGAIRFARDFSYIRTGYVDGYRTPRKFIVTEYPKPSIVSDFWSLVVESNYSQIIVLNQIDNLKRDTIFPKDKLVLVTRVGEINFENVGCEIFEEFTVLDIIVSVPSRKYENYIRVKIFSDWLSGSSLPKNQPCYLNFVANTMENNMKSIVMCQNGVTACGLHTGLAYIIEKLQDENVLDVPTVLEVVRRCDLDFLTCEEQIRFLYVAAEAFCSKIGIHDNIQYSEIST